MVFETAPDAIVRFSTPGFFGLMFQVPPIVGGFASQVIVSGTSVHEPVPSTQDFEASFDHTTCIFTAREESVFIEMPVITSPVREFTKRIESTVPLWRATWT
jgi:hypothetical protein